MSEILQLGTKAETLQRLEGKLADAQILPQVSFSVEKWEASSEKCWDDVKKSLGNSIDEGLIVRSSALDEDSEQTSQAGKYLSVGGVRNEEMFREAVTEVIDSYGKRNPENQVLVQPEFQNARCCGVAFTMDPNTGGHYYVISYDTTGSTSSITSGGQAKQRLFYRYKRDEGTSCPKELQRLCSTLKELEMLFGQPNLDVEFAFDEEESLYIFQVRPLVMTRESLPMEEQSAELDRIRDKIRRDQRPKPFLCGSKTIYSVMTDWNPAEMIGARPRQLALSLYQEIITDHIWAYQRDNYGYRNLRSVPLMIDMGGVPYIDVRASFNSFVPAELEEGLSEKLVDYYLKRLEENPAEHDKAEFNIVFSCYTFDLEEKIQALRDYGFTEAEVAQVMAALRNVTNRIIDHENGLWRKDLKKIEKLSQRYDLIMESDMSRVEKVYWLVEDCKRYGTLPFAGLARAAFIAVQILKSMVKCDILSEADYDAFMNGVNTVSSDMKKDFSRLSKGTFLEKYGHLRPGTYDITSPRYDETPDIYFDWEARSENATEVKTATFRLSMDQMNALKNELEKNGLTNDILSLLEFAKAVIEGREYGKFVFTKSISQVLRLIGEIGKEEGFSREECANLNVKIFQRLYASTEEIRAAYEDSIRRGIKKYDVTRTLVLPPVIISSEDVSSFFYPDSEPSFITQGKTNGEVCFLDRIDDTKNLDGKVVLIEGADPGYDWIFSHKIKGFITMYGGANSHMAIRAGELSIPAAVGIGGKLFEQYRKANVLELDTGAKTIKIIR